MHCKDFNLYEKLIEHKASVAVLGLGYVGFPLAIEFAKRFRTIGYDISSERIEELRGTFEEAIDITFTSNVADISDASLYVISVPTPVDENKNPDLNQLLESSAVVGKCLSPGNFVVYESTVYPGCTEDKCIPVLEKESGLVCGDDFKVGYTPERINPNDAKHTLTNTVKIVSACDDEALDCIANIYNNIVDAGVELVSCIKVAEASKVLENTQRNVNIALMNEMAMLFSAMDIDMTEVLKAASTKWNFVNYSPGLVGGHCIPVAPWFLVSAALERNIDMRLVKMSSLVNDDMASFIVQESLKRIDTIVKSAEQPIRALVMGYAYKENIDDIRNTLVEPIVKQLEEASMEVDIVDPFVNPAKAKAMYGRDLKLKPEAPYDLIMVTVAHDCYIDLDNDYFMSIARSNRSLLVDIRGIYKSKVKTLNYYSL
jgi:nucleotide sugar dehydrogenase